MEALIPIKRHYKKLFEQEFYNGGSNIITPDIRSRMESKAYAWYYVSYHPSELGDDDSENMISFPWIVHDILCDIAVRNNHKVKGTRRVSTPPTATFTEGTIRSTHNNQNGFNNNQNGFYNTTNYRNGSNGVSMEPIDLLGPDDVNSNIFSTGNQNQNYNFDQNQDLISGLNDKYEPSKYQHSIDDDLMADIEMLKLSIKKKY
ncbi:hypothetical protein RhiirB3_414114 [Rhizophagus irregularis]|nr:hypothetical protein RhiirB3_414114 [Rhizophagus irregularis]